MSNTHTHATVQQEEDLLPPRIILFVILGVITFSLLLVGVAYAILQSRERELRPSGEFSELSLGPIVQRSNVYEELFGNAGQGQLTVQSDRQSLERFQWADRKKRTVRVPIGAAIEMYVNSGAP
jgi:hypothetical protein